MMVFQENLTENSRHIKSFSDWKEFCLKKILEKEGTKERKEKANKNFKRQWEPCKSSPLLAEYWLNPKNQKDMEIFFTEVLNQEICFDIGIPEYDAIFDNEQNSRQHDLFIATSKKDTIITIEAKAKESFYKTFEEEWNRKKSSSMEKRLKGLRDNYFHGEYDEIKNIPYQILHWFAGSLADARMLKSDNIIMTLQQFHDTDKKISEENIRCFGKFIRYISCKEEIEFDECKSKSGFFITKPINTKYTEGRSLFLNLLTINTQKQCNASDKAVRGNLEE